MALPGARIPRRSPMYSSARLLPAVLAASILSLGPSFAAQTSIADPASATPTATESRTTADPAVDALPAPNPLPASGAELAWSLAICRDAGVTTERISDWRACAGYLAGIINGASAAASILGAAQLFCIPDGTSDATLQDGLIRYMSETPAAAALPATSAVIDALVSTYPCE